jgi:uncharacterized membrane protein YkvA (DUF1232 family)
MWLLFGAGAVDCQGRRRGGAAYALSPIDLVPDFIPVLGYLDDLLIVPADILLAVKLVPKPIMNELRAEAARRGGWPVSRAGLAFIVSLWVISAMLLIWLFWPLAAAQGH